MDISSIVEDDGDDNINVCTLLDREKKRLADIIAFQDSHLDMMTRRHQSQMETGDIQIRKGKSDIEKWKKRNNELRQHIEMAKKSGRDEIESLNVEIQELKHKLPSTTQEPLHSYAQMWSTKSPSFVRPSPTIVRPSTSAFVRLASKSPVTFSTPQSAGPQLGLVAPAQLLFAQFDRSRSRDRSK